MFKLNFKIELSDLALILGLLLITFGIYMIYKPAAVIFLGTALILLAFLSVPRERPKEGR